MEPIVGDLEIDLGTRLRSRAIIAEDPADEAVHVDPRESRGAPGTRAPHLWLERDGERISTLDLFGRSFVLLAGPDGEEWRLAALDGAAQLGLSSTPTAWAAASSPTRTAPSARSTAPGRQEPCSSGPTASSPGGRAGRSRTRGRVLADALAQILGR